MARSYARHLQSECLPAVLPLLEAAVRRGAVLRCRGRTTSARWYVAPTRHIGALAWQQGLNAATGSSGLSWRHCKSLGALRQCGLVHSTSMPGPQGANIGFGASQRTLAHRRVVHGRLKQLVGAEKAPQTRVTRCKESGNASQPGRRLRQVRLKAQQPNSLALGDRRGWSHGAQLLSSLFRS